MVEMICGKVGCQPAVKDEQVVDGEKNDENRKPVHKSIQLLHRILQQVCTTPHSC